MRVAAMRLFIFRVSCLGVVHLESTPRYDTTVPSKVREGTECKSYRPTLRLGIGFKLQSKRPHRWPSYDTRFAVGYTQSIFRERESWQSWYEITIAPDKVAFL